MATVGVCIKCSNDRSYDPVRDGVEIEGGLNTKDLTEFQSGEEETDNQPRGLLYIVQNATRGR